MIYLPKSVGQLAKGMIAFGVFITHAVACYVAIDLSWNQYCERKIKDKGKKTLWEYILRTTIVFFTCKWPLSRFDGNNPLI